MPSDSAFLCLICTETASSKRFFEILSVRAYKSEVVTTEQVAKVTEICKLSVYLSLSHINFTPLFTGAVASLETGLRRLVLTIVPLIQASMIGPATPTYVETFSYLKCVQIKVARCSDVPN